MLSAYYMKLYNLPCSVQQLCWLLWQITEGIIQHNPGVCSWVMQLVFFFLVKIKVKGLWLQTSQSDTLPFLFRTWEFPAHGKVAYSLVLESWSAAFLYKHVVANPAYRRDRHVLLHCSDFLCFANRVLNIWKNRLVLCRLSILHTIKS